MRQGHVIRSAPCVPAVSRSLRSTPARGRGPAFSAKGGSAATRRIQHQAVDPSTSFPRWIAALRDVHRALCLGAFPDHAVLAGGVGERRDPARFGRIPMAPSTAARRHHELRPRRCHIFAGPRSASSEPGGPDWGSATTTSRDECVVARSEAPGRDDSMNGERSRVLRRGVPRSGPSRHRRPLRPFRTTAVTNSARVRGAVGPSPGGPDGSARRHRSVCGRQLRPPRGFLGVLPRPVGHGGRGGLIVCPRLGGAVHERGGRAVDSGRGAGIPSPRTAAVHRRNPGRGAATTPG
jgi:hypothetical protein